MRSVPQKLIQREREIGVRIDTLNSQFVASFGTIINIPYFLI